MELDERTKILLGQIELFSDLNDDEITQIARQVTLREFAKGEVIFHAEDTNKLMYVVLKGEVKVFQLAENGREMILAFHCTGDSFGEIPLLDQLASPATVTAVEDSMIAIITRHDFFEIIHSQPNVLNKLLLTLTRRLRHSWDQNRLLHFKDAAHRIRSLLFNLSENRGKLHQGEVTLNMRLTHQCLADMTGLTRETVTRVIDKWKREQHLYRDADRRLVIRASFFEENEVL